MAEIRAVYLRDQMVPIIPVHRGKDRRTLLNVGLRG